MELITDKKGEPRMYMVTASEIAGSGETLNALLPDAAPGTMICTAGYGTIRQKAADGAWATL